MSWLSSIKSIYLACFENCNSTTSYQPNLFAFEQQKHLINLFDRHITSCCYSNIFRSTISKAATANKAQTQQRQATSIWRRRLLTPPHLSKLPIWKKMQTTTRQSWWWGTQQNNTKAEQQLLKSKSTRRTSQCQSRAPSDVTRGVATRRSWYGFFRSFGPYNGYKFLIQSRWLKKLKLTDGGADFPLVLNVNCILSVNFTFHHLQKCEHRHFGISTHYHQPRCEHRQSGGATFITASATFMMRTTTIWSCTFYQYNLFSMRTPTFRTIICTFNAQYDPNFNVWGPEKVIYFHLYYDSCSFLVYDLLLQSQCHCCLIRFGCNFAKRVQLIKIHQNLQ